MNESAPFNRHDLDELDALIYSTAARVVPMRDVFKGDNGSNVIGLRHDVDDNAGSFDTALRMAEWEMDNGYSSTYFLLHHSHYWADRLCDAYMFEEMGHEVGIHVNAIAEALRQKRNAHVILAEALSELRSTGVRVVGSVAHGDPLCHKAQFVNDEIFTECYREHKRDRLIEAGGVVYPLEQLPLSVFDLEYDANWLPRGDYLSDSGGKWSQPFGEVATRVGKIGQLHMLVHPDWWARAFVEVPVG